MSIHSSESRESSARRGWVGDLWHWLTEPGSVVQEPARRRSARVLVSVLLITALLGVSATLVRLAVGLWEAPAIVLSVSTGIMCLAYALGRTRFYRGALWVALAVLVVSPTALVLAGGKAASEISWALAVAAVPLVLSGVFGGPRAPALVLGVQLGIGVLCVWFLPAVSWQQLAVPFGILVCVAALAQLSARRQRWMEDDLDSTRAAGISSLQEIRDLLEQRVSERTTELERGARLSAVSAQIARAACGLPKQRALLARCAQIIGNELELYHAGVYLLDVSAQWADLVATFGGQSGLLLERGQRLRTIEQTVVGFVARRGEPYAVQDVDRDPLFDPCSELPETRAQLALPLVLENKVIGVLDLQSQERGGLDIMDIGVLQGVTDQLALAVYTTRLVSELEERSRAERRALGAASRDLWRRLIEARPYLGFVKDREVLETVDQPIRPEAAAVLSSGQGLHLDDAEQSYLLPIKIRDQVVGVVDARRPGEGDWSVEQEQLLQNVVEELGQALESAQLYEDAQRRAAREQLTRDLVDQFRSAGDMRRLLQTAIQEVAVTLGASRAFVQWIPQDRDSFSNGAGNGKDS